MIASRRAKQSYTTHHIAGKRLTKRFRSVRFKVMVVYLLLILFAMQLVGGYFIQSLNGYYIDNNAKSISREAQVLANLVAVPVSKQRFDPRHIKPILQTFSQFSSASVYILDKDGIVLATSANPFLLGQKRVDPEVTGALVGLQTKQIAIDPQTGNRYLYLAIPIRIGAQIVGAVEFVSPMSGIYQSISSIIIIFATAALLSLVLSVILAGVIARTITGPITDVTRTARAMASGDFDQQVTIYSNDEIGELASTFNMLTSRLRHAMENTEREKDRLQAVMTRMSDGVIATNPHDEILLINPAAMKLLAVSQPLQGVTLSHLLGQHYIPGKIYFMERENRVIAISVTALLSERAVRKKNQLKDKNSTISGGFVYVMRDVTDETRLEEARRRFVADVSHELRTPITIIKGYIEALKEGAVEDTETAYHFLDVMDKESDRMTRLIGNLMQLIRFDEHHEWIKKEQIALRDVLDRMEQRYALVAFKAGVQFLVQVKEDSVVYGDRDRLEQVLDNIDSNALKYTKARDSIRLVADVDRSTMQAVVRVTDTGSGIPKTDLPHIFDRFYRVDKARSRQLGGTGLGLAIVREIITAHQGEVHAKSEVGKGTTITITLPLWTEEGDYR